jgi:hypothetical protein
LVCDECQEPIPAAAADDGTSHSHYYTCANCGGGHRHVHCRSCAVKLSRRDPPRCPDARYTQGHLYLKVPATLELASAANATAVGASAGSSGALLPCVLYGNTGALKKVVRSLTKMQRQTETQTKMQRQRQAQAQAQAQVQVQAQAQAQAQAQTQAQAQAQTPRPAGAAASGPPAVNQTATTTTRFPAHWGSPPRVQTMDMRQLPGDHGVGSGVLARWVADKMAADGDGASQGQRQGQMHGQRPRHGMGMGGSSAQAQSAVTGTQPTRPMTTATMGNHKAGHLCGSSCAAPAPAVTGKAQQQAHSQPQQSKPQSRWGAPLVVQSHGCGCPPLHNIPTTATSASMRMSMSMAVYRSVYTALGGTAKRTSPPSSL